MRKALLLALIYLTAMHLAPASFAQDGVASRIAALPAGARIELRLKNNQKMTGTTGAVSASGFTLVNPRTGDRQIVFDDVVSVRQIKSHVTRNVLIGVGIGVAALGITAALIARCAPLGCGKHTL